MASDDEIEEIKEGHSQNLCNPPYSNSHKWSLHEEQVIQEHATNFNFKNISVHTTYLVQLLPGRTPGAIYKKLVATRTMLRIPNTYWSASQITALRKGIKEFGLNWKSISFKYLQNKSEQDCKRQYITLQQIDKNKLSEEISAALSSIKKNIDYYIQQQVSQEELTQLTQPLLQYQNYLEQKRHKVNTKHTMSIKNTKIDNIIMYIQQEQDLKKINKTLCSYICDQ